MVCSIDGRRLVGCVLALWVACSASTAQAGAAELVIKARAAYENLEYDAVLPLLTKALKQKPSKSLEVQIYELTGIMHAIYSRNEEAIAAFVEVLNRDASFELPPETSPKILEVFSHARMRKPATVEATQTDAPSPSQSTDVPPMLPQRDVFQDFGFEEKPQVRRSSGAFYKTWWFWTAVGVVAVGAGVTAWALTRDTAPDATYGAFEL